MATCKGCGAEVIWMRSANTGKMQPINVEPDPEGNIVVLSSDEFLVLHKGENPDANHRYRTTSHFATCPKSKQFRRCEKCHYYPCRCAA